MTSVCVFSNPLFYGMNVSTTSTPQVIWAYKLYILCKLAQLMPYVSDSFAILAEQVRAKAHPTSATTRTGTPGGEVTAGAITMADLAKEVTILEMTISLRDATIASLRGEIEQLLIQSGKVRPGREMLALLK